MPAHPDCPEPLKTAQEEMEAAVQAFKVSLAYQAPEMHRELWITLQHDLAIAMTTMFESMGANQVVLLWDSQAEKGDNPVLEGVFVSESAANSYVFKEYHYEEERESFSCETKEVKR